MNEYDDIKNKSFLGNCLTIMPQFPDKIFNAIICDLPYNLTKNKKDILIPFEPLWKEYERIIKDSGIIILFGQGIFYVDLVNSNRKLFRYDLIWDKDYISGFLNANKMPLRVHEQIAIFYKQKGVYNPQFSIGSPLHSKGHSYKHKKIKNQNYGDFKIIDDIRKGETKKYPKSIWKFKKPHPSICKHPTEKSIPLLEELIKTYTNENDLILDNCAGSFTTALACINTKRNYTCIEIDNEYYYKGLNRIKSNIVSDDFNNFI